MSADAPHDELGLVEDLLAAFDSAGAASFVGGRLMQAGLERRRVALLQHYLLSADVAAMESLDLGLEPVGGERGAELTLVGGVLGSLQEAITAIAQSVRDRPTSRGLVPSEIQMLVRMKVAFALPGSLTLRLIPDKRQAELPVDEHGTLLDQSIDKLMSILSVEDTDRESALELIGFAGPRAASHLAALAALVQRSGASLSLRWRSGSNVNRTRFRPRDAMRLSGLLKEVDQQERERVYRGRLVGGSLVRATFELEIDDESVISGRVAVDVLDLLSDYFGQECTATVQIREARLSSGETKEHIHLTRLQP